MKTKIIPFIFFFLIFSLIAKADNDWMNEYYDKGRCLDGNDTSTLTTRSTQSISIINGVLKINTIDKFLRNYSTYRPGDIDIITSSTVKINDLDFQSASIKKAFNPGDYRFTSGGSYFCYLINGEDSYGKEDWDIYILSIMTIGESKTVSWDFERKDVEKNNGMGNGVSFTFRSKEKAERFLSALKSGNYPSSDQNKSTSTIQIPQKKVIPLPIEQADLQRISDELEKLDLTEPTPVTEDTEVNSNLNPENDVFNNTNKSIENLQNNVADEQLFFNGDKVLYFGKEPSKTPSDPIIEEMIHYNKNKNNNVQPVELSPQEIKHIEAEIPKSFPKEQIWNDLSNKMIENFKNDNELLKGFNKDQLEKYINIVREKLSELGDLNGVLKDIVPDFIKEPLKPLINSLFNEPKQDSTLSSWIKDKAINPIMDKFNNAKKEVLCKDLSELECSYKELEFTAKNPFNSMKGITKAVHNPIQEKFFKLFGIAEKELGIKE